MKYTTYTDRNGNKCLMVKPNKGRGFSIQTNGNLPLIHSSCWRVVGLSEAMAFELNNHVKAYGTRYQKELLGIN